MSLLSKVTGRQHHFKVLITYYPNPGQGQPSIDRRVNIWMPDRSLIGNDRAIKKVIAPGLVAELPRHLRTNGEVIVREAYYLGWFKPVDRRKA